MLHQKSKFLSEAHYLLSYIERKLLGKNLLNFIRENELVEKRLYFINKGIWFKRRLK